MSSPHMVSHPCIHVVDTCFGDVKDRRNGCLNVIQRMYFDASFPLILPEQGPLKCLKAKLDSR